MFARLLPRRSPARLTIAALVVGLLHGPAAQAVVGPAPRVSVAVSGYASLALLPDGSVWGWGNIGSSMSRPTRLTDLQGIQALSTGQDHFLALTNDGSVLSWGSNRWGQLGDGAPVDPATGVLPPPDGIRPAPMAITGLTGVTQVVAAGSYSLALKADGTVWAWGSNKEGGLGVPGAPSSATPSQVSGLPVITSIAAGTYEALAVAQDGSVWHWGRTASRAGAAVNAPNALPGLTGITAVATGETFGLGLKQDGTVWSWGQDLYGEMGNGPDGASDLPAQIATLTDVTQIAAGDSFGLAVKSDASLWSWGRNQGGQLGNGTRTNQPAPGAVSGLSDVVAVDGGAEHAVAVTGDGRLWALGSTMSTVRTQPGELSLPQDTAPPVWLDGSSASLVAFADQVGTVTWTSAYTPGDLFRYGIFIDGVRVATAGGFSTSTKVRGLPPGGSYTVTVQAQDAAGNWTTDGPSTTGRNMSGRLAAGGDTSLVVQPDGTLLAWGDNSVGQLGIGSTTDSAVPVRPRGIQDVLQVTTSGYRTLALRADGTAWEWGAATAAAPAQTEPTLITGLTDLVSVSAGDGYAVAAQSDGRAWRWNQVGGATAEGLTLFPRRMVATSSGRTIAGLTSTDELYELRADDYFQRSTTNIAAMAGREYGGALYVYGNGSAGTDLVGSSIDLRNVTMVATGDYHYVALKADGTVWAWGKNNKGQLGDGTTIERSAPVKVAALSDVIAIAAGADHSLAMTADGQVWAWGSNRQGQLGDGTTQDSLTPVRVAQPVTDSEAPAWTSGSQVTFSNLNPTGVTLTWPAATDNRGVVGYRVYVGADRVEATAQPTMTLRDLYAEQPYTLSVSALDGQGNESVRLTGSITTPAVPPEARVEVISAQGSASFARTAEGLWLWGRDAGWYPTEETAFRLLTRPEPGDLVAISTGNTHSLGLRVDGTVLAWGQNEKGQLGNGVASPNSAWFPPAPVEGLTNVKQVMADISYSVALKQDGTVWTWGSGHTYGQLGDGIGEDRYRPAQVVGLTDVVSIATNLYRTIALKSDGTVWAWGYNNKGQLGDGTNAVRWAPVQVVGLTGIQAIAAGPRHSLALRTDGSLWAWGENDYGQLGKYPYGNWEERPVQVQALSGITAVAAGGKHSLAVQADGTLWAWGMNGAGQLGDGTELTHSTPVKVPGISALAVAAGTAHSVALRSDHTVWVWGGPYLGTSEARYLSRPAPVPIPSVDTQAPVWSGPSLTVKRVDQAWVEVSWATPSDADEIAFYRIYQAGVPVATVPGGVHRYLVGPITGTPPLFQVQARDRSGNWSTNGPTGTVPVDREAPRLGTARDGKPALWLGMVLGGELLYTRPKTATSGTITFSARSAASYQLRAELTEPLSRVEINGQSVAVTNTASESTFAASFAAPITAGQSATLRITIYDLAGNQTVLPTVQVQADAVAPTITISDAKQSETELTRYVTFTGTASEELLDLLVWDQDWAEFIPPLSITTRSDKSWSVKVQLPDLADGESVHLRVVGIDYALNASEPNPNGADRRTFYGGTAPPDTPVLSSPTFPGGTLITTAKSLTLKGKTAIGTSVKVDLNNALGQSTFFTAKVDRNGNFTLTLPLTEGTFTLRLWAEDLDGFQSEPLGYIITRDTTSPSLVGVSLHIKRGNEWSYLEPLRTPKGEYAFSLNGADAYELVGAFTEAPSTLTVNGKSTGVSLSAASFTGAVSGLKNGTNTFKLVAKDAAGNTGQVTVMISLDLTAPTLTVSLPSTNLILGSVAGLTQVTKEFSGTASEPLRNLRIIDQATGQELVLGRTITIDPRDARKWKAQITFPLDWTQSWTFRFEGEDLAGNRSKADTGGKDRRTATVDLGLPIISLAKELPDVIYTSGNDTWATKGKLTLSGRVEDSDSGIKELVIGTTRLKPSKGKEKGFDFSTVISLTEGKLTTIKVYAEDLAGNRSPLKTIHVLYRSKISSLSVKATWSRTTHSLTITGTTDLPVKPKDQYVAVLPLLITIKDKQGNDVYSFTLDGASVSGYAFDKGSYTLTLNNPNLPDGEYTVSVTAIAPASMPWLPAKNVTTKVMVQQ